MRHQRALKSRFFFVNFRPILNRSSMSKYSKNRAAMEHVTDQCSHITADDSAVGHVLLQIASMYLWISMCHNQIQPDCGEQLHCIFISATASDIARLWRWTDTVSAPLNPWTPTYCWNAGFPGSKGHLQTWCLAGNDDESCSKCQENEKEECHRCWWWTVTATLSNSGQTTNKQCRRKSNIKLVLASLEALT